MNRYWKSGAALAIVAILVASAAHDGAAYRAPKTHEVRMTNEGGTVRFEPKDLMIQDGDTVKWIAAGGSHNIKFWPDSVPQGAVDPLKKATTDSLETQRFPTAGDSFSIVFTGMPKGTYKYYCRPHLGRGMVASIMVH